MPGLFDPLTINKLLLKNRFVRSATVESLGEQGKVTDALVSLHRELARGEVGLIISGGLYPKKAGQMMPGELGADSDDVIPGLKRLVAVVHENGGKIAAQLMHGGWHCKTALTGFPPEGPSAMTHPRTGLKVCEFSSDEVYEMVEVFVQAARRAVEAGFDGVQLHAAHSHLLSTFLSPVINRRTDEWGGSAENRARFVRLIYQGIRKMASPDYPVLIKLGLADTHPGGKPLSEGIAFAKMLQGDGIDAIEISEGFEVAEGHHIREKAVEPCFLEDCREARRALTVPLMLVCGLRRLSDMEKIVGDGIADAVSMCRPFIADPCIVQKFRLGLAKESECFSCNDCVWRMVKDNEFKCVMVG